MSDLRTERSALIARLRQEPRGPLCDAAADMLEADGKQPRLTDEDINQLGVECGVVPEEFWSEAHIEFARAIERKVRGEA